jgi:threonine synthase
MTDITAGGRHMGVQSEVSPEIDFTGEPKWNTPLVRLETESNTHHCNVYAKLEIVNPTGVHKDRESAMVMLDMKKKGFNELVCSSSGNAAISISAFAFMNGFKAHVFVGDIPDEKLQLISMFQPEIHKVKGAYLEAVDAMRRYMVGKNVYNANAGYCPAKLEGNSYIGYEIARDLKVDYVVCPTNNGTHFVGAGMGVRRTGSKAKMVAAVAPKSLIASSITGFYGIEQPKIDTLIGETRGQLIQISDDELTKSTKSLAKQGIFAEPASAASVAALSHIDSISGSTICCTITGSAMKYPHAMRELLTMRG